MGSREVILDAAREELAVSGRISMTAVAERAGVSRQTIHHHFGGLRGLQSAVVPNAGAEAPEPSTRERLVDAAERVLSRPGGGEASIEAIAAEAGLTKGAVYHHFGDRSELVRAVAARVSPVGRIVGALEESAGQPDRERLVALARAYNEAVGQRADLIRNLAANASRDPELLEIVMHEILSKGAPVILGFFRERIEAGAFRRVDPSLAIQALFGPAFLRIVLGPGIFELLRAIGAQPAAEDLDAYVDLLLAGLAAPPDPVRPAG